MASYDVKLRSADDSIQRHVKAGSNGSFRILIMPNDDSIEKNQAFLELLVKTITLMDSTLASKLVINKEV